MAEEQTSTASGYYVKIGGAEFTQGKKDGMERLVLEDHVDMVNMLTVRLGGGEGQPEWNFNIGDPVECRLGKGQDAIFKGEVVAMEPGYQVEGIASITLRALDKMHRLGRGRKSRHWEEMKDSDVAKEVGAESGLSVDADPTDETMPYILQRNESNIAFIKRLAARNNFLCRVVGDKLEFKKATFGGAGKEIAMGGNLRSMRMAYNSMDQVQKVVVRGWDIAAKEEIVGQASAGDITSIGGGKRGAEVSGAFGDSTAYVTDVPVSSQAMANAIAKSELERMARQFCRGSASVNGDDSIRAGTMVTFKGLPKGQNGSVYVMATRHIVSQRSGYTTEFTFCSNTLGD